MDDRHDPDLTVLLLLAAPVTFLVSLAGAAAVRLLFLS